MPTVASRELFDVLALLGLSHTWSHSYYCYFSGRFLTPRVARLFAARQAGVGQRQCIETRLFALDASQGQQHRWPQTLMPLLAEPAGLARLRLRLRLGLGHRVRMRVHRLGVLQRFPQRFHQ